MRLLGPKFPNVAEDRGRLYVRSAYTDFAEELVTAEGVTWRPWDARRSKLGAGVLKRLSQIGLREGDSVLYLGAAHGYTPTFVADIIGETGVVFALDFSATVVRDLTRRARVRQNIIPLLGDAKRPETWSFRVTGVDALIMDIAQRDQIGIFLKNCELFLKDGGFGILSLKARSVDMTRDPREIFRETYRVLEQRCKVVDYRELDPFERDHALFVVKWEPADPNAPAREAPGTKPAPRSAQGYGAGSHARDGGNSGSAGNRGAYPDRAARSWPRAEQQREGPRGFSQQGAPARRPVYDNDSRGPARSYGNASYGGSAHGNASNGYRHSRNDNGYGGAPTNRYPPRGSGPYGREPSGDNRYNNSSRENNDRGHTANGSWPNAGPRRGPARGGPRR